MLVNVIVIYAYIIEIKDIKSNVRGYNIYEFANIFRNM